MSVAFAYRDLVSIFFSALTYSATTTCRNILLGELTQLECVVLFACHLRAEPKKIKIKA